MTVWQGTQAVNADYVELAQALRFSRAKTLVKIYLPSVLPYFFSGARLAFGFGWRVSLVAETLGASSGVGYRLRQAADLIQMDQVFAWTIVLGIMFISSVYNRLTMPEFSATLLGLMGISSGTYIGFKFPEKQ